MEKGLKLIVKWFWKRIPTFTEVTGKTDAGELIIQIITLLIFKPEESDT